MAEAVSPADWGAVAAPPPTTQWPDVTPAQGGQPARITVRPASALPASQSDPAAWGAIPKPDIGRGAALGRGVKAGVTFGFGDELEGATAASGVPQMLSGLAGEDHNTFVRLLGKVIEKPAVIASPSIGALRLLYEQIAGQNDPNLSGLVSGQQPKGEATARYETARDAEREANKTAQEQYPGTYLAGQVAGGVAVPIPGGAAVGASRLARAGYGALAGAGAGAVTGLGEGEGVTDSLKHAAGGAAVGGVLGGAAPPLLEGGTRLIGALASKPINMVRAAISPTSAAERTIGGAYGQAARVDPAAINRLTPQELSPAGPAIVMDTLGQPGRNLARSAGNISGEARDVLNQTLDPRFEEQVPRLIGWLRSTFHFPDVHAQQEAIDQVSKTVNNAAYARAMREPGAQSMWDEGFQQLTAAPAVRDAIKAASTSGANRAAAQGFRPPVNPFQFAADGTMTMKPGVTPSLQFWDQVGKNLRGQIGIAKRAGDDTLVGELQPLRVSLLNHLDELVPTYAQARSGAAHFFGAENALEAGQRFVSENFAIPQTRAALARMSPSERQLFQDGFVSRYMETLSKVPDRADVVRRIYNTPEARQKIEIALGPQRARELEAMLRVENIMQQSLRAVQGNSTTAMQLIGAGLAGAGGGGFLGFDPTTSGLAAALATAGKKGIDHRVATRIAELLTSRDPAVLRHGARVIANNGRLMDALRIADGSAARIGGQQSTNIPALQAAGIGRTEGDQPNVPRPPGQ